MKDNLQKIKGGLQSLPIDERDFKFGSVFGYVNVDDINDFMVENPIEIKDQGDLDFCVAFSTCAVSEDQEGVKLNPYWFFSQVKRISGNWKEWGANLRDGAKAGVKYGFIDIFESKDLPRDTMANWENWSSDYNELAKKHIKKSYFSIDEYGYKDLFDAIRGSMWKNRQDKCSVISGALWSYDWNYAKNGVIPKKYNGQGVPHAFKIFGQKTINGEPHLMIQNSFGKNFGDNGIYYFPREVVNREFKYGNFSFYDMPKEQAEILNNLNISKKWVWLAKIVAKIKELLKI